MQTPVGVRFSHQIRPGVTGRISRYRSSVLKQLSCAAGAQLLWRCGIGIQTEHTILGGEKIVD